MACGAGRCRPGGELVHARSSDPKDSLGQILLAGNVIESGAVARALARQREEPSRPLGSLLVEMGALSFVALGNALISLFGAFVGGHLTFKLGTMVNRHAFTEFPEEWFEAGDPKDFGEGELKLAHAGSIPVLVVRRNGTLNAIAATCSHAGGPLQEGRLDGDIVTCPWHGSRFCVRDGAVKGGPATFAQPVFLVHEDAGRVRLRAARSGH